MYESAPINNSLFSHLLYYYSYFLYTSSAFLALFFLDMVSNFAVRAKISSAPFMERSTVLILQATCIGIVVHFCYFYGSGAIVNFQFELISAGDHFEITFIATQGLDACEHLGGHLSLLVDHQFIK